MIISRFLTTSSASLCISLVLTSYTSAQIDTELEKEPAADTPEAIVDQVMGAYGPEGPGGVVAVIRDGKVQFSASYGLANIEYAIPNSISTPYHMASVSKQFTAFAIVMLAQEGKLALDDDVRKYLPELFDFGHTITLRNLLNHTSGLRDHWVLWTLSGGLMDDVIRQKDLMRLVVRQRALNFEPGAEFAYSNTGYLLLSEVVSRVSEETFGEWMAANVFEPLGMDSTQIYDDHERLVSGRAYSYKENGRAKAVLSYANSGATSLFTTAEDLALWLNNFRTGEVGGHAAIEQLQEKGVLSSGETIDYALGILVEEHNGLRLLVHGGGDAGYRTWLGYYPAIDAGVVILGNDVGLAPGRTGIAVAEAFFSEHMQLERQSTNASEMEQETSVSEQWAPDAGTLSAYAGNYYSRELETFYSIVLDGEELKIEHRRHGRFDLEPKDKDSFDSSQWFIDRVTFDRDYDGNVVALRIGNGRVRNLYFERVTWPIAD